MSRTIGPVLLAFVALFPVAAQEGPRAPVSLTGVALLDDVRRAQFLFEQFRRENLPSYSGQARSGRQCDDQIGVFCYWYDENAPAPPPEPVSIRQQRSRLLALLDSAGTEFPADDWVAGQRVRYLIEDGQGKAAIHAALACRGEAWWCSALLGFAYHDARDYVRADSVYLAALDLMPARVRCDWTDVSVLLDEYTVRSYRRTQCGTPERAAYESRLWWLAKPMYSMPGMDTRTEFLARMTMTRMLEQAPSPHTMGFDVDERELLLRYGWPRAWSRGGRIPGTMEVNIIGHEPTPSYQFLPPATLANSPAMSDSVDWEDGVPPVHARYAPAYAQRIRALTHQSALFRRGDSAAVVVAWDATRAPIGTDQQRELAVVLARADSLKPVVTRDAHAPLRGHIIASGPWGQLLFSAEMHADGIDTIARARYGMRPPYAIGARVTLSDMLFFAHYDSLPATLDEAAVHAMPSIRLRSSDKLGVYFESYGTNPAGEKLKVTITVAREEQEPGFIRRRLQALRLSPQSSPVSITIEDQSKRGERMTPRAAYLDISTLKKGAYIVQLEVEVAGQYVVRSEKSIEVTG
jgi:hypothetical protein